jgi:hypothetical protein
LVSWAAHLGFFLFKMLRMFGITTNSNDGHVRSDDDKENQMPTTNAPSHPEAPPEDSPEEVLMTSPPPSAGEQQGGDDLTTADAGVSRLPPRQLFCPSINSTPSSISTADAPRIDLTVERQSAVFRDDQEDEEDPNQPYLECSKPEHGVNLSHLKEEEQEQGDGDSCASAPEFEDIGDATEEALQDRLLLLANNEVDKMSDKRENGVILQKGFSKEISITTAPPDFKPKAPNPAKGEPSFPNVDNPGNWSEYTFRPEFAKKDKGGNYTCHSLPTGAVPVPVANDGKREAAGWEFHYKGWKHDSVDDVSFRSGASPENLFPKTRQGCLDAELLKKMGLTEARMANEDALFFLQLLLPMCDPAKSGIDGDPRRPYYTKVEAWTQKYATSLGLGGSYGHEFKPVLAQELVHFDAALVRDGVHGGSDGALYRRWQTTSTIFDARIANSITHTRWLQIKRTLKLCDNDLAPKRGEKGYDPAYKYDYIYRTIIDNLNALTERAELDLCGDETTYGHMGFGEPGSGLVARIMGKPGISKGGQIVLVSDASRNRPRIYMHRHKCYEKYDGWNKQGPAEVRRLLEKIMPRIEGEIEIEGLRQIFTERPHTTWDNFFSGCQIFDWLGEKGFGATMTCRRDRLPCQVPKEYLHAKKTVSDTRSRAARFNEPVTAVKQTLFSLDDTEHMPYKRVHVSFQSTSSTNISTVNALNSNKLFVVKKERGQGVNKRKWAIEMNEARQLYLKTYGRIDTIDSLIRSCHVYYRSWKYWHSAKNHGTSLAIVVAYDMYQECAEGKICLDWKVDPKKVMDFHTFRDRLSTQGLAYSPINGRYPGDRAMRVYTKLSLKERQRMFQEKAIPKRSRGRPSNASIRTSSTNKSVVTPEQFELGKRNRIKSRLCGDFGSLSDHLATFAEPAAKIKYSKLCEWCGEPAYTQCLVCAVALHFYPTTGKNKGKGCAIHYHNEMCFGLGFKDHQVLHKKAKPTWVEPTPHATNKNRKHIMALKEGLGLV